MLDILFKNVDIVDGTGQPRHRGSVGVLDGRIVPPQADAKLVIDGEGLLLCPGFIDAHSHGDIALGTTHGMTCKTSQGVTTEIAGQCGLTLFPSLPGRPSAISGMSGDAQTGEIPCFPTFADYLKAMTPLPKSANVAFLTGHGALRSAAMGYDNRQPTPSELEQMKDMLRESLQNGSYGLSSGLIYLPGVYSGRQELVELCKVVHECGGVYATHMRNESAFVLDALEEAIYVAETTDVPLFISHHKVCGRPYWGLSEKTLEMIESARQRGLCITMDQYPYDANMTQLNVCIPPQYLSNGANGVAELLRNAEARKRIAAEMESGTEFENMYLNAGGFSGILVASAPRSPAAEGKTISDYAQQQGCDPFDAYFDLLVENDGAGTAIFQTMDLRDVERIYLNENTVVGSDGIVLKADEKTHPRAWGSFARAICQFAIKQGLLTFEQAVRKQTGLTAERWGIPNKGFIKDGFDADLVLIAPDRFEDRADFVNSNALCEGIELVVVGGKIVWRDKTLTGEFPGQVLLRR